MKWVEAMSLLYKLTLEREFGVTADVVVAKKDAATVVPEP